MSAPCSRLPQLIISLTSYPARIATVHLVIESLINQTLRADKIILWLAPEQFPGRESDLPEELLALIPMGLTIDWYHDIRSYKKLIPTLKRYPDDIIITADDDILYPCNMVSDLYDTYTKYKGEPIVVSSSVSRLYMHGDNLYFVGRADLYLDKDSHCLPGVAAPSVFNKLRGGSGTLYPPGCLHPEIMDEEKFMTLAPTSDDIWFYRCAVKNGCRIVAPPSGKHRLNLIAGTQEVGLFKINDAPGVGCFTQHLHNLTKGDAQLQEIFLAEHEINQHVLLNLATEAIRKKLFSCRIDIRNLGNQDNTVEIDESAFIEVFAPEWLRSEQGQGKMVVCTGASVRLVVTAKGTGKMNLILRAPKYMIGDRNPACYCVDFTSIKIDADKSYFTSASHNSPHKIELDVVDGQRIELCLSLVPHWYPYAELRRLIASIFPRDAFMHDNADCLTRRILREIVSARASLPHEMEGNDKDTEAPSLLVLEELSALKQEVKIIQQENLHLRQQCSDLLLAVNTLISKLNAGA